MNFQQRALNWALSTFDIVHVNNSYVRACRFGEEALELMQSVGVTRDDAMRLVNYVYDRPVGEIPQEVGGTMVTLAVLCEVLHLDMERQGEAELSRCWNNIEKIRAKQAQKSSFGNDPLPGVTVVVHNNVTNLKDTSVRNIPLTEAEAMGLCNCWQTTVREAWHLYGSEGCKHQNKEVSHYD